MSSAKLLDEVTEAIEEMHPSEGLAWLSTRFGATAKFSTSLGLEDQVITALIGKYADALEIFTLDTGRLFQETYDVLQLTRAKYKHAIQTYFPDTAQLQSLITAKGPNSFYDSVENRKECCFIRKVEPLNRALKNAEVWITGVRADQSQNRKTMRVVEWDEARQLVKYNPLLNWTAADVLLFIDTHNVPVNTLHKKGYPSIGCAPCTRAIMEGEDERAGRWWWESSAKECGLHETK